MSLPRPLQKHIADALDAMREHPHFDLLPFYRLGIYQFFDGLSGLKGRTARTHISIMAAQRVRHLYDIMPEEHGYPTMVRLMISTAEQLVSYLREGANEQQLNELAQGIMIEVGVGPKLTAIEFAQLAQEMHALSGEAPTSLYYHAWCAFLAAMNALEQALGWDSFRNAVIDSSTSNADLRFTTGDTAKWAAIAYAGGVWTGFEEQDPYEFVPQGNWDYLFPDVRAKRKEFWEWWCAEVIPAGWRVVEE